MKKKLVLGIIPLVAVATILIASTSSSVINLGEKSSSLPPETSLAKSNDFGLNFFMEGADAIQAPYPAGYIVHKLTLIAQSVDLPIPGGTKYHAMTFNSTVPGPTIRVTQGDIIEITLVVPSTEITAHSLDMHSSRISAVPNFGPVMPGTSHTYAFIANTPGIFKYHCEGVGVIGMDQHVFSGMYGMTIVDPMNGYYKLLVERTTAQNGQVSLARTLVDPAAYEFTLQYSQLYLTSDGSYNQDAMFKHQATWNVVNGKPFGYDPVVTKVWKGAGGHDEAAPLIVPVGKHIRFFVLNQGDQPLFFHIVGSIMDRVTQGNSVLAQGVQTWQIGGSQEAMIDTVFDEPGAYVAVNHDYAALFSGAASVILAQDSPAPNPSDAVPPDSSVPGTSIHQDTFFHCEGSGDSCNYVQAAASPPKISFDKPVYQQGSTATVSVTFGPQYTSLPSTLSATVSDGMNNDKTVTLSGTSNTFSGQINLNGNCDPADNTCISTPPHNMIYATLHDDLTNTDLETTAMVVKDTSSPDIWLDDMNYTLAQYAAITVYDPNAIKDSGNTEARISATITSTNSSGQAGDTTSISLAEARDESTGKWGPIFANPLMLQFTNQKTDPNPDAPAYKAHIGDTVTASYAPGLATAPVSSTLNIVDRTNHAKNGFGSQVAWTSMLQTWPIPSNAKANCSLNGGNLANDGVCDYWKNNHYGTGDKLYIKMYGTTYPVYKYNNCGSSFPLDPVCPSVNNKDIFVQVDSVAGWEPLLNQSFVNVTTVFSSIHGTGIPKPPHLHVIVNHNIYGLQPQGPPANIPSSCTQTGGTNPTCIPQNMSSDWSQNNEVDLPLDFNNIKHVNFQNANENPAYVAQSQVFHYVLLASQIGVVCPDPTHPSNCQADNLSSGAAEVYGNDAIITLGAFGLKPSGSTVNYPTDWLEGTFMHELGHNFNLSHDGSSTSLLNCEPNYLSAMSYTRQMGSSFSWPTRTVDLNLYGGIPTTLNYSGEVLNTLDEFGAAPLGPNVLINNFPLGIANGPDKSTVWGPPISGGTWGSSSNPPQLCTSNSGPNCAWNTNQMTSVPSSSSGTITYWNGNPSTSCPTCNPPNDSPLAVDGLNVQNPTIPSENIACLVSTPSSSVSNVVGYNDWSYILSNPSSNKPLVFTSSSNFDLGFGRGDFTGPHTELTVIGYHLLITTVMEGIKNMIDYAATQDPSIQVSVFDAKIHDAIVSIVTNNYSQASADLNYLNQNCHTLITNSTTSAKICDNYITNENHAISLTLPPNIIPPVAIVSWNAAPGGTVLLNGTSSTGNYLQYSWHQTSGVPVALIGANTAQPTFVLPYIAQGQTRTWTFQLTVSNPEGQSSASVTFSFTVVSPGHPPVPALPSGQVLPSGPVPTVKSQ